MSRHLPVLAAALALAAGLARAQEAPATTDERTRLLRFYDLTTRLLERDLARQDLDVHEVPDLMAADHDRDLDFHTAEFLGLSVHARHESAGTVLDFAEGSDDDLVRRLYREAEVARGGLAGIEDVEAGDGFLLVRGSPPARSAVLDLLTRLRERRHRPIAYELHELALGPGAEAIETLAPGGLVSGEGLALVLQGARSGAGDRRLVQSVRLAALDGQRACHYDGTRRRFLGDIDRRANAVGIGGGGAEAVTVSDPVVSECATGVLLKLRGRALDGGAVALDLSWSTARFLGMATVEMQGGVVETPRLEVAPVGAHLVIPAGHAAVLEHPAPGPTGVGGERRWLLVRAVVAGD